MPFKGGRATLTLATEGSIIRLPRESKKVDGYFKQAFGLGPNLGAEALRRSVAGLAKPAPGVTEGDPGGEAGAVSANEKYRPKSDELVRVPFRLISATIVAGGSWRATDFSKPGVLERSRGLMVGIPAFTDHMQWCGNHIGVIESAAYTAAKATVPAGIDGVYLIDAKMNEQLVRGLLMPVPSVQSSSVTVEYEWEPSHEFEDEDDFFRNVGKIGADGKMVTRVATKILAYYESSILWMGADPYAKMLDEEGCPMNVDYGSTYDEATKYAKDFYEKEKKYFVSDSFSKQRLYLSATTVAEQQTDKHMDKVKLLILSVLGLAADAELPEDFESKIKIVKAEDVIAQADLDKVKGENESLTKQVKILTEAAPEIATLKSEKVALTGKIAALEPLAATGRTVIENKRAEVIRLAKLQSGDKYNDALEGLIKKAETTELDAMLAQYTNGVTEKFEATCKKCGEHEFEFRSTLAPDNKPEPKVEPETEESFLRNNF